MALLLGTLAATPVRADAGTPLPTAWHAPLSDDAELPLPPLSTGVPSPSDVLGYAVGERFTLGHRVADYFETLAESSPRVTLWSYGESYEGRPLQIAAISSPENLARLEALRTKHLERLETGSTESSDGTVAPVFVWLSYGVHGNESSSTEAAMATAYVLAAAGGEWSDRLDDVVVLLDPLTNPDGRERYVQYYNGRAGRHPDPRRDAAEHREPWPGGRQNHYLNDLNRDWAWLSQLETRHRVREFLRWEPHVFVDLHEMGPTSTYFFPPSASPVHPMIDPTTVDWLEEFGAHNAATFEEQGWVFYTGEQYDLFYPGYGDSYPSLRQSVGMTYEMAGGGRAGLAFERPTGSTLRLADRTARHLTASLATVETAARQRAQLVADQLAARAAVLERKSELYLWPAEQPNADAAARLLLAHGIRVERLTEPWSTSAAPFAGDETMRRDFAAGSYVVDTRQGGGQLVRTLFELEAELDPDFVRDQRERVDQHRDTQFYDITAWALPLAFDLETWRTDRRPPAGRTSALAAVEPEGSIEGEGEFGLLIPAQGIATYRAAALLQREGIAYRQLQSHSRSAHGGLFVALREAGATDAAALERIVGESGVRAIRVESGYDDEGIPYGSEEHTTIRPSRIGLVLGEGIYPPGYGHLWHLLDETVGASHHQIRRDDLVSALSDLDAVVLPHGEGYDRWDEAAAGKIAEWVERGGVLVAVAGAAEWLRDAEVIDPEAWPRSEAEDPRSLFVPGVALQTVGAGPHPLFAGLQTSPPVLFYSDAIWPPTGDPAQDLLTADLEHPIIAGFAWDESAEELAGALLVGEFRRSDGRILVFAQDPAFRNFWRATMPLFLNAVLHGPSWP